MIKANELRIGNYADRLYWNPQPGHEANEKEICKVVSINPLMRVSIELKNSKTIIAKYPLSSLFPIPLTPEILEKCGYNIGSNGSWIHENDSLANDFELEYDKSEKHNFIPTINIGEYNVGIAIKYLHQLQNKYFDWYGEELEIKL